MTDKVYGPLFITVRPSKHYADPLVSRGWLRQIEYPYRTGTGIRLVLGYHAVVVGLCRKHKRWSVRDAGGFHSAGGLTQIGELARAEEMETTGDVAHTWNVDTDRRSTDGRAGAEPASR